MVEPDSDDALKCEQEVFQISSLLEARDAVNICLNCNRQFSNSENYKKHTEKRICEPKYTCKFCNSTFGRSDHLRRHIFCVHKIEMNTDCPVCNQKCDDIKKVGIHVRRDHKSTVSFPCRVCCFECPSYMELKRHETSHLNVQNKCKHCNTQFKRRDHMLRHIQSLHLKTTFKCTVCHHNFKRKDHLTRHVRDKHSGPILVR